MEPAIEIAERGHAVASIVAYKWAAAVPELKDLPGFAQTFMPRGRAPEVSELVRFPGHAKTLRKLAEQGPRAYYEGEIAETDRRVCTEGGGAMTARRSAQLPRGLGRADRKDYRGLYRA